MAVDPARTAEEFTSDSRQVVMQQQQQGPGQPGQLVPQRYKFTPDELRVLRECNRESFYYRCLPIGTTLGVAAYYAVRSGHLKPSVRFGAGPKTFVACIFGYFIGKFSYQSKCVEKIMNLPNSPLAEVLRKQKGKMGFQETLSMEPGFVTAAPIAAPAFPDSEYGVQDPASFTDVGDTRPMTSFDTESSTFTGFDYSKYDTTQQMLNDDNLPAKKPQLNTSYDELRKQNRDEYEHRPGSQIGGLHSGDSSQGIKRPPAPRKATNAPTEARNIYGDVWDDKSQ